MSPLPFAWGTVNSPGPGQMELVPGVLVRGHSHVSAEVQSPAWSRLRVKEPQPCCSAQQ